MNKKIVVSLFILIGVGLLLFIFLRTKDAASLKKNDVGLAPISNQPVMNNNLEKVSPTSTVLSTTSSAMNQAMNGNEDKKNAAVNGEMILFYGSGCPHCAAVKDYMAKNNLSAKAKITEKEVYFDRNNALELQARAKDCGLSTDRIGVPFLWDKGQCVIGDVNIINLFKERFNL